MILGNWLRRTLAIDAGSSNIVLALRGAEVVSREASLIALSAPDTDTPKRRANKQRGAALLGVGSDAAMYPVMDDNGVRLVLPIFHGRLADPRALGLILAKMLRNSRRHWLENLVVAKRVGFVLPPHLDAEERGRYEQVLWEFGFGRIRIIEGCAAAARGCNIDQTLRSGRMLIDIGGGKTTTATFILGSRITWSWYPVGGRNLDEAIGDYVERRYRLRLPPAMAEAIKLTVGSVYPRPQPETMEISGFDPVTGIEKKVSLDDNEIRDVLIDGCEPLVLAIHQAFEGMAPELAADIARSQITLVGGGALLAGLPEFLQERTGLSFLLAPDPINVSIKGALALLQEVR